MPLASQPCQKKGRILLASHAAREPNRLFLRRYSCGTTILQPHYCLALQASQMPIDYSRFDNIDVSDDEDEQAYKARKEAEEAGRRASKAQAKECVEAWWQACRSRASSRWSARRGSRARDDVALQHVGPAQGPRAGLRAAPDEGRLAGGPSKVCSSTSRSSASACRA